MAFMVGESDVEDTAFSSESEEEGDDDGVEEESDDEVTNNALLTEEERGTLDFDEISDEMRIAASKKKDKLELHLPPRYSSTIPERLLNRLGDFLENDLKREVTHLYIRISFITGPLPPLEPIRRVISPSGLQSLLIIGPMGNPTSANLIRDVLGSNFPRLRTIHLLETAITDGSVVRDLLLNNPQLELLNIGDSNGPFTADGIRDINIGLLGPVSKNLFHLNIGSLGIDDAALAILCGGLSECKSLKDLLLQDNRLTKASIPLLTTLVRQLSSLSHLKINANNLLFKDAPLDEVNALVRTWITGNLKRVGIQKSGLSGPSYASVVKILSTSPTLTTLGLDLDHTETQRALEQTIPQFQSLRSLYVWGWTPQLTQAVLRSMSLRYIQCAGDDHNPDSVDNLFLPHFKSNKQIARARNLLQIQDSPSQQQQHAVPLGLWPKALSAISRTPEKRGETAIFLILQSQLAHWRISNQEEDDDPEENKKDSKSPPVPTPPSVVSPAAAAAAAATLDGDQTTISCADEAGSSKALPSAEHPLPNDDHVEVLKRRRIDEWIL